jgi:hypothetical protein
VVFPLIKIPQSQGQSASGIQPGVLGITNVAVVEDLMGNVIDFKHIVFQSGLNLFGFTMPPNAAILENKGWKW